MWSLEFAFEPSMWISRAKEGNLIPLIANSQERKLILEMIDGICFDGKLDIPALRDNLWLREFRFHPDDFTPYLMPSDGLAELLDVLFSVAVMENEQSWRCLVDSWVSLREPNEAKESIKHMLDHYSFARNLPFYIALSEKFDYLCP